MVANQDPRAGVQDEVLTTTEWEPTNTSLALGRRAAVSASQFSLLACATSRPISV